MKKKKISFETQFWLKHERENPFKVIDGIFKDNDLDSYKQTLGAVMVYLRKEEVYKEGYPCAVFAFYLAVRSLLKACYCLQFKSSKWKLAAPLSCTSALHQASLSREEYANPCLVFRTAFADQTLDQFEAFLSEAVELALSPYTDDGYWDVVTYYIHLVKLLDAAALLRERGLCKFN